MRNSTSKSKRGFLIMRLLVASSLILSIASFFLPNLATADTPDEIAIVYCDDCVPFHFTNKNGEADGPIIDHWKLWSEKTGVNIRFVAAPWNESLETIRNGKVDAHAGLFFSDERNTYLDYGTPISDTDTHVFFHEGIDFPKALAELKAYTIAVLKGDYVEGWLKDRLGGASIVSFPDYPSIVAALNSGEIKLFAADTPTGLFHLGKAGLLAKYKHEKLKPLYSNKWFSAVKKGNLELLELINQGMSQISAEERLRISRTWATGNRVKDADSIIIAVDDDYPPLSSVGIDGLPHGLMIDIWKEWGNAVGRKISFKASNWKQTLDGIRTGEADIHFGLFKTKDREQWLAFSDPLQSIKTGLFSKEEAGSVFSLAHMKGRNIGVVKGSFQAQYVKEKHPETSLIEVDSSTDYILALMRGDIAGVVEEVPAFTAAVAKYGLSGIIKQHSDLFENKVIAGVRKDNTALLELINSGLKKIPRDKLEEIEKRWISKPEDRFFASEKGVVDLTNEEKEWIKLHPTISIAATPDWPPFEWKDEETGAHKGIAADFIKLAAQKVGLKVQPEFGTWASHVKKLIAKEIDVAPGLTKTSEREKILLFSEAFTEDFAVTFVHTSQNPISKISDLYGKKVVVEKGYAIGELIARDHPQIELKLVGSTKEALQIVSSDEEYSYLGSQIAGSYLIKKYLIGNIRTTGFFNKKPGRYRFGIRNDWPLLKSIFDKALASITEEESNRIIRTYTGIETSVGKRISLTDKEREWINQHRSIRLGVDSSWPPFEFIDEDGVYSGLASSYMEALADRLDIKAIPQPNLTWSEAIKALENKEGIDVLPAVANTEERQKFMNFTKPYLTFPLVIATRADAKYVGSLKDLYGERVGVVGGYYTEHVLKTDHPEINLVTTQTVGEGLESLSDGDVLAFIDNLGVITYETDRLQIEDIKITAPTDYKTELSIGVRKDWPELIPILNKALDKIDQKERSAIQNAWLAVKVSFGTDFKTILMWAIPVGGGAALVIFVVVVWNRKMGAEIEQRKRTEKKLNTAHQELGEAMDHIQGSISYASRIQQSTLPRTEVLDSIFADYFVWWCPRDVVGGDMYWQRPWGAGNLILIGDCTGHGVPGAFMTMISSGALNEAHLEVPPGNPAELLQRMHQLIQETTGQDREGGASDDGLEVGVCYLPAHNESMVFSGARFSLFISEEDGVTEIKGDKSGLGYRGISHDVRFTNHEVEIKPDRRYYLTSDGLIDQVGGERKRGFGKRRFKDLIASLNKTPLAEQEQHIQKALIDYQGEQERRDDISVMGFAVSCSGDAKKKDNHTKGDDVVFPNQYLVGFDEIDDDHQKLFLLIDELNNAITRQDRVEISSKLDELYGYTRWHFRHEERLMQASQYPDADHHKEEHHKLMGEVLEIKRKFENGEDQIVASIPEFLKNWLFDHIMEVDNKLAHFLNDVSK